MDSAVASMPASLGTSFNWVTGSLGKMMDIIVANPVLMLGITAWCVGLAIGLFKRLV